MKLPLQTNPNASLFGGTIAKAGRWQGFSVLICLSMLFNACATTSKTTTPSLLTPTVSPTPADPPPSPSPTPDNSTAYNATLIFNDEFSGAQLNTSIWMTEYRWGPTNDPELQYYSPDALEIDNGILRIRAEKRPMDGMGYISGMIASYDRFTFTYGYVEIRAKLPAGQGLWPACWLHLNDDEKTGEIDIFEFLGHQPNTIHMIYHFPDVNGNSQDDGSLFTGPDYSQAFHTFSIDWEPEKIVWYIDGIERYRATHDIPNEPMYLLANLAIGGAWPGNPDSTTPFPAYYEIDYIRVYQRLGREDFHPSASIIHIKQKFTKYLIGQSSIWIGRRRSKS